MNVNENNQPTMIEFMAYYEMYFSVKKYGKSLPHNLQSIFTKDNLPEKAREMRQIMWKHRKHKNNKCMGTHSGRSVNCTHQVEPDKLICESCQNAITHYLCGGRYIGHIRLPRIIIRILASHIFQMDNRK